MNWPRWILITFLFIEFIGVSFLTTMMIPLRMIEGRIMMFVWVSLVIIFAVWCLLRGEKINEN